MIMIPDEVAADLKIDLSVVMDLIVTGELAAFELGGGWRIRRADLDAWIDARIAKSRHGIPPKTGTTEVLHLGAGDKEQSDVNTEPAVTAITPRVSQTEMHDRFVKALGRRVAHHGPLSAKPLEIDLGAPLPGRLRVYMFNATRPPGGRPLGEHKIQLIMPGQKRGERGSFDHDGERIVLLVGYSAEEDVFILWDAGLYVDFAWSRNVQVKAETIIEASAGKIAAQFRQLRGGGSDTVLETLIAAPASRLGEAVERRIQLSRQRLMED